MARLHDEEEDDAPIVKKRRRPKKKPVSDDDDDALPGRGGRGRADDDEEDEGENSFSTGNVFLDIFLDFVDDCTDWAKEHARTAIVLAILAILFLLAGFGLTVRYVINYLYRPTLEQALMAYDLGSYGESRFMAEEVLKYAKEEDNRTKAGAYFVLGAATCGIAEIAWDSNRQPYYLAAVSYLRQSEEYGFVRGRETEGYYWLGKSLYLSGELERCRAPLQHILESAATTTTALDEAETKNVYWYLCNSYFLAAQPDYVEALRNLRQFRLNKMTTEEERAEADLLDAMIRIRQDNVAGAEEAARRVPAFNRLQAMRSFVEGQIALLHARNNRRQAQQLENRRDPLSLGSIPVAVSPVEPEPTNPTDALNPFDNPETEQLLPQGQPQDVPPEEIMSEQPAAMVRPVLPVSPKDFNSRPRSHPWSAVTPPTPLDGENGTLHRRLAGLRSPFAVPYTQEAEKNDGVDFDPDAVIVLPTEKRPEAGPDAPIPDSIPNDTFKKPTVMNPVEKETRKFHQLAEKYYREAIEHFLDVQQHEDFSPRWKRQAHLLEGLCYEELGELAKAQEIYLAVADSYPQSSEAAAALFLRARIDHDLGRLDTAMRGFAEAFDIMRRTPGYACPWQTKESILARCEDMLRDAIVLKEYRQALTLLYLLRGVMPESDVAIRRGETYEDWAVHLSQQAATAFGSRGDELAAEANDKFRRSAEAFDLWTRIEYDSPDVDEYLWRAAENFRFGKDYRRAIPMYRRFLRSNVGDHRPETFLYLGEMYVHLDGIDEAADVLETALLDFPAHPLIPRVRYVLSRAYYEQKQWDKAGEMLQQNLIGEFAPTSAVFRDSLYALAQLNFERGQWEEAISGYESALQLHPNAIQAAEAHYCLAQSYLQRARQMIQDAAATPLEAVRKKVEADSLREQEKALAQFQKAEELLIKRQQALGLTEAEQLMLRNTLFGAGSILMQLKMYEQAIDTLNLSATRYQDRPEAMDALLNLAVAFRHLNNREEALAMLNRAEVVLRQLVKSGTIPAENSWTALIEVQKNLVNLEEIHK